MQKFRAIAYGWFVCESNHNYALIAKNLNKIHKKYSVSIQGES